METIRRLPDLNGPRMKYKEFTTDVVNKELWKEFKKEYPEHVDMTYKQFKDFWNEIAETIRIETIKNPLGVKLPSYAGELKLQFLPHRFQSPVRDPKILQETGPINHINLLTRGKVAKIKWERRWAVKFNRMLQFFGFEPVRSLRDDAREHIDANPDSLRVSRNTLGGDSVWRRLVPLKKKK